MHERPRLISLQRSQDLGSKPSQADGKMFLFSSLKLFIKGSLLPRPRERERGRETWLAFRICAKTRPEAHAAPKLEKKRLWSGLSFSHEHILFPSPRPPPFPPPFPSLSFDRPYTRRNLSPRGGGGCGERMDGGRRGEGRRGEGRNCVNYPLISASDPRITPRREC